MRDIASLLLRLEALSQAHRLNYTTYQALLAEMKKRLKAGSIPDFLQLHWLALLAAIEAAESTLKRSTGHYMEPIWAFFRRTSITLPEEVMDIESCDVTCLPKGKSHIFFPSCVI